MKNELTDYVLWFDGWITVESSRINQFIVKTKQLSVDRITPNISQYNKLVPQKERIFPKTKLNVISNEWNIPKEYSDLSINQYIDEKHMKLKKDWGWSDVEYSHRQDRISMEMKLFKSNDLDHLLRALIYIINTLKQHNQVWGTGRGSSVSSYILYILEVHDVDSYQFDLNISDFLK